MVRLRVPLPWGVPPEAPAGKPRLVVIGNGTAGARAV